MNHSGVYNGRSEVPEQRLIYNVVSMPGLLR